MKTDSGMSYFTLYKSAQLVEAYEAAKKIVVSFQNLDQ